MANPSSPSGLTGLIGQTFGGRYRLESPLGKGGFGAVFKATQLATGQTVAVKVMQVRSGRRAPTIDRQVARFHREMRLGASLNHPHIVRLIDSGTTENGLMYTVFEYVPGETLHSLVRGQGPLAPVVARDIMMQVLDALTAAHAAGIVHRDLKPQNIMVTGTIARDHAKVLDFGISGLLADAATEDLSRITLTREALGTPVYAAPEQLRGDPPTTRSDIYSWGLVFIELLIGQPVMKGRSVADVFHRQLSSEPVPIPVAVVNHPLGRLLASTVEKHVRRRVRSAAGLLAMLEAVDLSTLPDEGRVPLGSRASVEVSTTDFGGPTTDTVDLYLDDDEVQPPTDVTLADFSGPTGPTSSPGLGAVRRPVTALSVSVGVSSEGPVDVEVMDELLHDQLGWCKETVTDLGGHVVGVLGDRMLAVWGYPEANEHDARRAARAALDIAGQLQRRGRVLRSRQDVDLHYRAGLHSGILVRRGSERLGGVVTQVAARLESSAVDGSILASRPLWRQLSTRLEFHSGPAIGGISGGSWRLVGEGLDEALAATPAGGRRAVLVGRGREYGVLREAWRLVGEKRGQAIIVHSEAGVGKSRLVRELRGVVAQDGGEWLEVACAPEDGAASLGPIVALLRRVAGATGKPGARALDAWLRARGLEDAEQRTLVVQLVGLPLVEGLSPVALPPGRQRELRMQALGTVLAAGGQSGQVLVVEDLHWADPSTQELFGALASGAAEAGGLVLATTRPTPVALPESAHMLVLERLDGDAAAELARNAVDHGELSPELVARIVERSDGVPLFIEELARATVEGGRATLVDGEWQARGDDDAVPMSLFSMLQERLDRLGAARQTVQLAAALGRELDHRVLSAVALLDESTLQAHLDELILAGLLVRRRVLDAPGYLFRHALIRDTALDTLGAQERREVHAHIAETIERDLPDLVESRPELLALHYGAAGVHDKALDYGHKAAFGCLLRSENFEALALCERALSLADELPEAARGPARLGFLSVLIPACMATRGWADPTLKAAVDEALELTEHTPDHPAAFPVRWAAMLYYHLQGRYRTLSLELADALLAEADRTGSPAAQITGLAARGHCLWIDGRYPEMLEIWDRMLAAYDPGVHKPLMWTLGHDMKVWAGISYAEALYAMGHTARADALAEEVVDWARSLQHPSSHGLALLFCSLLRHDQGDREAVLALTAELLEMATRFGLAAHIAYGGVMRGWAMGDPQHAAFCLTLLEGGGHLLGTSFYRAVVAEALLETGDADGARAALDQALAYAEETGENYYLSRLHTLRARLDDDPASAEARLVAAVDLARRQGAAQLGLEAAVDLSTRLVARGDSDGAAGVLRDALAALPEDSASPLKDSASTRLGELRV